MENYIKENNEMVHMTDEQVEMLANKIDVKIKEQKKMKINSYVRRHIGSLIIDLLFMRLGQLSTVIGVMLTYFFVWDKFYTNDILYLVAWWMITGAPISLALGGMVGEAIGRYKKTEVKKIYKKAHQLYD